MKKTALGLILMVLLTGCGGPKLLTYSSSVSGLTFDYPLLSFGEEVSVTEADNTILLDTAKGTIASLKVMNIQPKADEMPMVEYLQTVLLNNSTACEMELLSADNNREVYGFDSTVFPFGDEFDQNCLLTTNVYYFPANMDKLVLVGTGQGPAFDDEGNLNFLNSIRFLP